MRISFIAIIFLISGCTARESDNQDAGQAQQTEDPPVMLADFQFTDIDGNTFSAEKYRGKRVFMHFWATWCRPCIQEMPSIAEMINRTDNIHFIFPSDEDLAKIRRFKEQNDFPFNYVQLKGGFQQVGISTLPTTYLFDENGQLSEVIIGAKNWDDEEF